jgi:hypothetical protein
MKSRGSRKWRRTEKSQPKAALGLLKALQLVLSFPKDEKPGGCRSGREAASVDKVDAPLDQPGAGSLPAGLLCQGRAASGRRKTFTP